MLLYPVRPVLDNRIFGTPGVAADQIAPIRTDEGG
jgi:hypothetical protein